MAKKPAAKSAKAEPKAKKAAPKTTVSKKAGKAAAPKAEKTLKVVKAAKETPVVEIGVEPVAEKPAKAPKAPKVPKAPKPKSAKALAAEKAIADENRKWAELRDKYSAEKAAPYAMSAVYEANKPLQHKVLGWGYILSVQNDRLEVLFEQGTKLLISNYKR